MKKILALLLLVTLASALFPALAQEDSAQSVTMMGYEPAENYRSWEDNLFFSRMQERTGISFVFRQYGKQDEYQAALESLKNNQNDLPQVLFKANLNPITAKKLYDDGVLIDLAPYLQEHAPNFYRLMEEDPEIRRAITLENGVIPALPYVLSNMGQNILWINTAWLNELNLTMPTTMEEFEKVLTAFQTGDPNRNGKKDEIPLSFIGSYDLKYLAHAFGLIANDFNIFVTDGVVKYMPMEEAFKPFIQKMAEMYKNGLLDKDGFSTIDSLRRVTDTKTANRYGAFFSPLPTGVVPLEWTSQYQAMLPLTCNGEAVYRAVAGKVNYGTFALTASCTDIPGMLSWVDYLYTEEGSKLATIGLQNEDYVVDGDGSWRLLSDKVDNLYVAKVIISNDQSAPGISNENYQFLYSDKIVRELTRQTASVAAVSKLPFPDIPLTEEDAANLAPLQARLGRFVDESIARFVLGEWETDDEQFTLFEQALKTMGVDDFVALWQAIYNKGMGK